MMIPLIPLAAGLAIKAGAGLTHLLANSVLNQAALKGATTAVNSLIPQNPIGEMGTEVAKEILHKMGERLGDKEDVKQQQDVSAQRRASSLPTLQPRG